MAPYCYLSAPQLAELAAEYDVVFDLKPVYPLAVSDPSFFKRVNPRQFYNNFSAEQS